ncbi:hypothetical protein XFF6990_200013 [Xanthomonas citri pv. fuscans]|nr:hypothetical protein XFF6990_200013 [Xanthomonas citri pv. fuscans]
MEPTYANSPIGSRNWHIAASNDKTLSVADRSMHREKALEMSLEQACEPQSNNEYLRDRF